MPHTVAERYAVAVVAVGLALLVRGMLPSFGVDPNVSPFTVFLASVMIAAWFGGFGPGLVATGLSAVAGWYFFLAPQYSFALEEFGQGLRVVVFVVEGTLIGLLAETIHSARRRAEGNARRARANEEDLRLSKEHLRLALEATGLGTWDFDPATGKVVADNHARTMLGLPSEGEVDHEAFLERVHPDDRERVGELVRHAMDPGNVGAEYTVQYRTVAGEDGVGRWVEARGRASFDAAGNVARFAGTILDISQRRRVEQEVRARARQQEAVAELGQKALQTTDLDALMREAVGSVARVLEVEYAKVLELLPGEELLLKAGVGWKRGLVGRAKIGAHRDYQAGYALQTDEPVIVDDLRSETRFRGTPLLNEHGVVSGMSVIIDPGGGRPFGVLGAHTGDRRAFTEDDINFLRGVANVIAAAIERERAEETQRVLAETGAVLSSSLDYRTTLASVARLAVPTLADWCAVDVLEDGNVERLAVAHEDPEKVALAIELQRRYPPDLESPGGVPRVMRTGLSEFYPAVTDQMVEAAARDEEHLRILREVGFSSAIIVPMIARGRTLGVVTMVAAESGRRYDEADLVLAEEIARRAASAVDNARLYKEAQREIAERERAQAELRSARDELEVILGGIADGVTAQDLTGRVIYANESAARMVGYPSGRAFVEAPSSEVLGRFEIMDEDGNPFPLENLPGRRALGGEETTEKVLKFRVLATGEERWSIVSAVPVFDERGEVRMAVNIFRDITDRKQAEDTLREIREAERRRIARDLHDGVLQDLSYTAGTLGLIMLGAERGSLEEEVQRSIDAIRRAAQGLRDAVNDLRLEEKQDTPFPQRVESLVLRNRIMARGIRMDLTVDEGVPDSPLGGTQTELLRIIQEALTNARRHSRADNILVTLGVEGGDLVVEVSDDGQGFGPETAPGVGLGSMRERAAVIGGRLEVTSEVGQGTSVRLRVPMPQKG